MKVMIVGAAGHVGTIIRPAMEAVFECTFFDRRPTPGAARAFVGDVNNEALIKQAVQGQDVIVYLAMGVRKDPQDGRPRADDIDMAFDVNVRGLYRFLKIGLAAGVRRFVYTSTLSVYKHLGQTPGLDETVPADGWEPYGLSKRAGELMCQMASQEESQATVIVLRLYRPCNSDEWDRYKAVPATRVGGFTGPQDTARLFVAAARCNQPGYHLMQATGDIDDHWYPNHRVAAFLGWRPENK